MTPSSRSVFTLSVSGALAVMAAMLLAGCLVDDPDAEDFDTTAFDEPVYAHATFAKTYDAQTTIQNQVVAGQWSLAYAETVEVIVPDTVDLDGPATLLSSDYYMSLERGADVPLTCSDLQGNVKVTVVSETGNIDLPVNLGNGDGVLCGDRASDGVASAIYIDNLWLERWSYDDELPIQVWVNLPTWMAGHTFRVCSMGHTWHSGYSEGSDVEIENTDVQVGAAHTVVMSLGGNPTTTGG